MHKILIVATTFISMMFAGFVVPALAQTSNTNPVIGETANIVGEWRAVRIENLMWNDKTWTHENTVLKIIVEEQSGPVFRGEIHYNAPHAPGHDGKTERAEHKFDVLGVFSWSGKEFTLVSHAADAIVYKGVFVNPHMIEVIGYEAGEYAWVARQLYIRE